MHKSLSLPYSEDRETDEGCDEMQVTVIGTGYVGLVTAIGLADAKHDVVCVDLIELPPPTLHLEVKDS